jgi:hypothetical protein
LPVCWKPTERHAERGGRRPVTGTQVPSCDLVVAISSQAGNFTGRSVDWSGGSHTGTDASTTTRTPTASPWRIDNGFILDQLGVDKSARKFGLH